MKLVRRTTSQARTWKVGCMTRLSRLGSCMAMVLVLPTTALAQVPDLHHCTTANVLFGGAGNADLRQPLFGGAVGWELAPHFFLEVTTKWFVPERGADAFSAIATAQIPLTGRRTVMPFLTAGAGAHRVSFGSDQSRIPIFYLRRLRDTGTLPDSERSFVDPAFIVGGGISIFTSGNVSVRPEVEVMLVRRQSENYLLTSASVRLAYHFETHNVTPDRVRR